MLQPRRSFVPLLIAAVVLGACVGGGVGGSAEPAGSKAALDGAWTLTAGTGPEGEVEVGGGVEVTLTIDGDAWGGAVCNSYHAQAVEVGDGTVTISDVPRTEMACLDDRMMRAEEAYLAAFTAVRSYEVSDEELRLTGDGVELVYAAVTPEPAPELVGTVWVLDSIIEGGGPDGSVRSADAEGATLELREDGTLVAGSGCLERDDGSTYEVDEDRLVISFAAEYDYDCESEELRAQDTVVWNVLAAEPTIAIDGQRLTLTAGEPGLGYRAGAGDVGDAGDAGEAARGEPATASLDVGDLGTSEGVSCGISPDDPGIVAGRSEVAVAPTDVRGDDRYDALERRLEFRGTVVPAGCSLGAWLHVRNPTMQTVTIRDCELGLGRGAIVPLDDPDTDLWQGPMADCAGDVDIPPGFDGGWSRLDLQASTMTGELLEPGAYLAVVEFDGLSGRFEQPITVVAAP